jgi:uncharacterized protein YodC (DUF2158 family)
MDENIKEGDVVRLKCGGPLMVVESIEAQSLYCRWFVNDKPEHNSFRIKTVKIVPENERSS